jgi:hypothetical protein
MHKPRAKPNRQDRSLFISRNAALKIQAPNQNGLRGIIRPNPRNQLRLGLPVFALHFADFGLCAQPLTVCIILHARIWFMALG